MNIYELKNKYAQDQGYQNWDDLFETEKLDEITEGYMDNFIDYLIINLNNKM